MQPELTHTYTNTNTLQTIQQIKNVYQIQANQPNQNQIKLIEHASNVCVPVEMQQRMFTIL